MNSVRPRARRDDLLIKDVLDEILVYDARSERAHSLNAAAAAVWRACDGQRTIEALVEVVRSETGEPWDEDVILLTLEQLREHDLLEPDAAPGGPLLSRRDLIERVAIPMMLMPLVTSLTVPTTAMAQSGMNGPQGPQGMQGPQGVTGPQSLIGTLLTIAGAQGPQGPQGVQGFQGPVELQSFALTLTGGAWDALTVGTDGPQGPQGIRGPQGPAVPLSID